MIRASVLTLRRVARSSIDRVRLCSTGAGVYAHDCSRNYRTDCLEPLSTQSRWEAHRLFSGRSWTLPLLTSAAAAYTAREILLADDGESTPPWVHGPRPGLTWSALVGALSATQETLPRAAGFSAQRRRRVRPHSADVEEFDGESSRTHPVWEYTLEFSAAPEVNMFDLFSSLVNAFCGPGQARVSSQELATRTTLHAMRDNDFELTVVVPRHGGVDRRVILEVMRAEADASFSATEVAAIMRAYEMSQGSVQGAVSDAPARSHNYHETFDQRASTDARTPVMGNEASPFLHQVPSRDVSIRMENAKRKLEELGAEVFMPKEPLSWDILAGYDDVKNVIDESIILPLKHPEVYDSIVRGTRERFESVLPRAVLLTGKPGVGKTTVAKILASGVGVPFVNLRLESLLSKYYGETTRKMSEILETTKSLGPCVVFCDEIDALGSSREAPEAHEVTRRTLSVLLRHLDGLEGPQESVLVAATNLPGMLDSALMSRFDVVIALDLPDALTRSAILKRYAKQLTSTERDSLAAIAHGFSGRELRDACEAAERAHAGRVVRASVDKRANSNESPQSERSVAEDQAKWTPGLPVFEDYLAAIRRKAGTSIGRNVTGGSAASQSHDIPIAV